MSHWFTARLQSTESVYMSMDESIPETPLPTDSADDAIPATLATSSPAPSSSAPPPLSTSRWKYHFWFLAVSTVILTVALLLDVSDEGTATSLPWIGELPPLCTWKRLMGSDCPGCGLTRSFAALVRGEWSTAWRFNAAGWMFFAVCVYQIPFRIAQLWRIHQGRADYRHSLAIVNVMVWSLLAVMITQWIWRMMA